MENLSKTKMDEIIAHVMSNNISDIRSLLTNNGIVDAGSLNDSDTQIAFLKAIKDSASFRNDFSDYLATMVQGQSNFVQQPNMPFVNQPNMPFVSQPNMPFVNEPGSTGLINQPMLNAVSLEDAENMDLGSGTTTTKTTTTKTTGSFWSSLGGLASKENLQSLFNAGLGVASNALTAKANKESEERALELERLRLQQLQAQKELGLNADGSKRGLSTGAVIGIVLGLGVLTTVIVLLAKKKK